MPESGPGQPNGAGHGTYLPPPTSGGGLNRSNLAQRDVDTRCTNHLDLKMVRNTANSSARLSTRTRHSASVAHRAFSHGPVRLVRWPFPPVPWAKGQRSGAPSLGGGCSARTSACARRVRPAPRPRSRGPRRHVGVACGSSAGLKSVTLSSGRQRRSDPLPKCMRASCFGRSQGSGVHRLEPPEPREVCR